MKRKRIYISGPMTDHNTGRVSQENLERFIVAEDKLRRAGFTHIVNPISVWACRWPWLYRLMERTLGHKRAYALVLLYDLWLLMRCQNIYMLDRWADSFGARTEYTFAERFGIFHYFEADAPFDDLPLLRIKNAEFDILGFIQQKARKAYENQSKQQL